MSGNDERRRDSEFECQRCGENPNFWYLLGFKFNGWRIYGVLRNLSESIRKEGIRISVVARSADVREANLDFYKQSYWLWQLQCPLCMKTHNGGYRAHKQARYLIRGLRPTEFRSVIMSDIL